VELRYALKFHVDLALSHQVGEGLNGCRTQRRWAAPKWSNTIVTGIAMI
jgi:hypothetical protein